MLISLGNKKGAPTSLLEPLTGNQPLTAIALPLSCDDRSQLFWVALASCSTQDSPSLVQPLSSLASVSLLTLQMHSLSEWPQSLSPLDLAARSALGFLCRCLHIRRFGRSSSRAAGVPFAGAFANSTVATAILAAASTIRAAAPLGTAIANQLASVRLRCNLILGSAGKARSASHPYGTNSKK